VCQCWRIIKELLKLLRRRRRRQRQTSLPVYDQMKEMFPHPCPRKDKFQWIMGVRPVVQAAPAVIQALLQVVLLLII